MLVKTNVHVHASVRLLENLKRYCQPFVMLRFGFDASKIFHNKVHTYRTANNKYSLRLLLHPLRNLIRAL